MLKLGQVKLVFEARKMQNGELS